jgi:hypothetical protein
VESLGGSLEIESPREKGTVLRARIPLRDPARSAAVVSAQEARVIAGRGDGMPDGSPVVSLSSTPSAVRT